MSDSGTVSSRKRGSKGGVSHVIRGVEVARGADQRALYEWAMVDQLVGMKKGDRMRSDTCDFKS